MNSQLLKQYKIRIAEFDSRIKKTITDETHLSLPVTDGIVNVEAYKNARFRILWIMKEVNEPSLKKGIRGGWDMRKFIQSELTEYPKWKQTYLPIIYSTWGILNGFCKWEERPKINDNPWMIEVLRNIAFINLKKLPGYSVSSPAVIMDAYEKNKNLILDQIKLIDPQIIIGGGTLHYLYKDLVLSFDIMEKKGSSIKASRLYISHYHPNQRKINGKEYYNDILIPVKNWSRSVGS